MKIKISYQTHEKDVAAEVAINLMAYAVQGTPLETRFVKNGKDNLREMIFRIPEGSELNSISGVFCETVSEILDEFGYRSTFGIT